MSSQKTIHWEKFSNDGHPCGTKYDYTKRLKVPGGWLVKTWCVTSDGNVEYPSSVSQSLCFLPDTNHEWVI